MPEDAGTSPSFLSSLPSQPITDEIVKQIGESENPKIRGAMAFPGSTPGAVEAFMLDMTRKTHVIVFDPSADKWRVYGSFTAEDLSHEETVDRASNLANEWFAESLSERMSAAEEPDS